MVMTELWVMPSRAPADTGGVMMRPPLHHEDVLPGALADVALRRQQDGLVVARLEGLDLGHRAS